MALDWIIKMIGHFEGLDDNQLAQIEQTLPAFKQLIDTSIKLKPTVEKLLPLYQQASPIIAEAKPLIDQLVPQIEQAVAEWGKVAPVVSLILTKLNNHQSVNVKDLANSGFPWT